MERIVKFPFGKADLKSEDYDSAIDVDVLNMETLLEIGELTGDLTLNLKVNHQVDAGANLTVIAVADGTARTLTFGTGIEAKAHSVTASKKFAYTFKYDGQTFVQTAINQLN